MKYLSLVLLALCLLGCSAEKQRIRRVEKAKIIAYQNPKDFAEFCSTNYPIIPTYILGKDSIIERTVTIKGDSIPCPKVVGQKIVYVKCPDTKVVYRDILRIDTLIKENTAKVTDLTSKLAFTQAELKEVKQSDDKHDKLAQTRLFWLIGLGILLLGSWYLLFTKW